MPDSQVMDFYRERAARLRSDAEELRRRIRLLGNVRLAFFFVWVAVLVYAERNVSAFAGVLIVGLLLFVAMVRRHRGMRRELADLEDRAALCDTGAARIERNWDALPTILPAPAGARSHPYADDLDLFGAPSVSQLLGPLRTLHGARTLRAWLEQPAALSAIHDRQAAVRVLAGDVAFRETLNVVAGRIPRASQRRVAAFLKWVEESPGARIAAPLIILARALPLITFATIGAAAIGMIPAEYVYAPIIASILLCVFALPRAYRAFGAAFTDEPAPLNYAKTFAAAEQVPAGASLLERQKHALVDGGTASVSIHKLEQIMYCSDARRSGIFALVLEALFLWSLNVWIALEKWRRADGPRAGGWFEALGNIEALSSMAALAHDNPAWTFPAVAADATSIQAAEIGHPMLPAHIRVTNDVEVGPAGSLLLVTGSNMSGKSTLLRAIGVNSVLAHAGAPVCAATFRTPPVRLFTSINVRDSLAMGASLYMAQLARLKEIIEAARVAPADQPCCYLLDEILSGTNSADRTTAVRAIVHELMNLNTIGALTTHDLALAADEQIMRHAVPIHFSETIDPATASMTFDYRIRPGVVRTSNALALMKLMGFRLD